jgi:hypothetical protein
MKHPGTPFVLGNPEGYQGRTGCLGAGLGSCGLEPLKRMEVVVVEAGAAFNHLVAP